MFWIRGLFILFLWTLTRAQNIFYGSFSGLEVQPLQVYPGFQYRPQVNAQGSDDVAQEPTYPFQPLQVYPGFQYTPQVHAQGSDDVAQEPTYQFQPKLAIGSAVIDTFSGSPCTT